jgi:dolichyl-phosphate-mannose--protein O-mannosyl transferase
MFWQKRKKLVIGYLVLVVLVFMFFYPHWTGIFVPKWFDELYYWLPSWK